MTDLRARGDLLPIAAPFFQGFADFDVKGGAHAGSIAKFCDSRKQHFASGSADTACMVKKPVNQVVAEALRFFMGAKWNNVSLARASGVAEGTIRNYLAPEKRDTGKTGKQPSAKLAELELLADALGVTVADLVRDATDEERLAAHRQHAANYYREHGSLPRWAPDSTDPAKQTDLAAA